MRILEIPFYTSFQDTKTHFVNVNPISRISQFCRFVISGDRSL